ncbi:hypothetical protein [Embleya hyalina]|uniref:Uncharacterized protein n=1 Tax=Embleya hyalina TaxID=516124 RepID=A0A401YHJ3_9ACTN|nr:hypothetical protein [Embleya hyalina]GCD94085.1 hypothetical protein EHYA_01741 [Embleya hyalina]
MAISGANRRMIRTSVQWVISAAAAAPLIVDASGIPEATPGVAVGLAVAAGLTRVMALPAVDRLLPSWLRAVDPRADIRPALDGRRE